MGQIGIKTNMCLYKGSQSGLPTKPSYKRGPRRTNRYTGILFVVIDIVVAAAAVIIIDVCVVIIIIVVVVVVVVVVY